MKRLFRILLTFCLIIGLFPAVTLAADESRSYNFDFAVNGKTEVTAAAGDIVTLTLVLERTDSSETADMYAAQAEFWYDDTFFELVEGSVMTNNNVEWTDAARRTGGRSFYLNFVSQNKGTPWESRVQMGTFQFRVIGESGSSVIDSDKCRVSTQDGRDSFAVTDNDVTVVISSECTVTFDSAGGSEVPSQKVIYGEKIQKPEDPIRAGYTFNGWYSDLDRSKLWDFDKDTVKENMTLYAGWTKGTAATPPTGDDGNMRLWIVALLALLLMILLVLLFGKKTVRFDSCGGSAVESIKVKKGERIDCPAEPTKPGSSFGGWYHDEVCTNPWIFESHKVTKNITLYARWM